MASCKNCSRSGLFLGVDRLGLCKSCEPIVLLATKETVRLLDDSLRIINASKNLDTKISRVEFISSKIEDLRTYEQKRITTTSPPPSEILRSLAEQKRTMIATGIENEVKATLEKIQILPSSNGKVTALSKTLLKIKEWTKHTDDAEKSRDQEILLQAALHKVQLETLLDKAEKAEFKGSKKKALDAYYEVLYFLLHDDIDDATQKENIKRTKDRIQSLGGKTD